SSSRFASSPTTRKKTVISPSLTQWRRSAETSPPPTRIDRRVVHSVSYEWRSGVLAHTSASSAASSRTTALPVSVPRKSRTGAAMLRAQAVRPACVWASAEVALNAALRGARRRFGRSTWTQASCRSAAIGGAYAAAHNAYWTVPASWFRLRALSRRADSPARHRCIRPPRVLRRRPSGYPASRTPRRRGASGPIFHLGSPGGEAVGMVLATRNEPLLLRVAGAVTIARRLQP